MKKHYREENDCLNCGTILEGKFCHNCGQENLQIKESFGHMMNHAISDYFHFDHQFFHTLKPLLFQPGKLTNEYMAGHRVQYLHPVKMYIFISVVYFLVLFQTGKNFVSVKENNVPAHTTSVKDSVNKVNKYGNVSFDQAPGPPININISGSHKYKRTGMNIITDTSYAQYLAEQQKLPANERDGFFGRMISKRAISYKHKYGDRGQEVFKEELQHNVPKMMFLLLPLFALILRVAFWNSRKFYVEHLIYAFHLHCFLFLFLVLILLPQLLIPNTVFISVLNWIAFIYIIWYIYKSLQAVYHRSTFRTISKMIGITVMYLFVFIFCITLVTVITALMVS